MKTKIQKQFIYEGFGFPVTLENVELVKIENEWHPKIDVKQVATNVIKLIPLQKSRLTGSQIKFIRTYFSMSLRKFAKEVAHESHTAVSKWESFGSKITNMDSNIEVMIRLFVVEKVATKTLKEKNKFYDMYMEIKNLHSF